jgi:NADPH:quinone reductase-like Zn-dependent oxidoreductase
MEEIMKAVRFDRYGGIEVLQVADVPVPEPSRGEVLVMVKAASINPGEAKIRQGLMHAMWPATFPSGEGSDLAGIVTKVGPGIEGFTVGDEVIGFTNQRASHAEYVIVEAQNLISKPVKVPWEVAGSLRSPVARPMHQCAQYRSRGATPWRYQPPRAASGR